MTLTVRIGYHEPYLPTPRCTKHRYKKKEEQIKMELQEVPESELAHAFDIFVNEAGLRKDGTEYPWDVVRIRLYRRTVNGKYVYYREARGSDVSNNIAYDTNKNPFRELVFQLRNMDRFVLYNEHNCRDFLIQKAAVYLDSFLLAGGVLYKETMAPVWRIHTADNSHWKEKSYVRMYLAMTPSRNIPGPWATEVEFPWHARDKALKYAQQEATRVGADTVEYFKLETIIQR